MAVVGRQCGRIRLTSGFLAELETALHRAGIHTDRLLNARSTKQADWVRFSATAFAPSEVEFGCEKQLVNLVVDSVGKVPPLNHLRIVRREYALPSGRRIDLVCQEIARSNNGDIVAVEFKKGRANAAVVEQLAYYLEELQSTRIANGRAVRGILLAQNVLTRVNLAASSSRSIEIYEYPFSFRRVGAGRSNGAAHQRDFA
ncbi:MAG: DUF91 domain-containing protein [Acidobacteria bacterium]|nr:DUF91 domain-containing protein [Acidobacteriota bacterium]